MDNLPVIRIEIFDENGDFVKEQTFNQPLIRIGKAGQNHLRLDYPSVSRQHAIIEVTGDGSVFIRDLESTNGTIVNGKQIKEVELIDKDTIKLGDVRLIVHISGSDTAGQVTRSLADEFYLKKEKIEYGPGVQINASVAILWNNNLIDVRNIKPNKTFTIGSTEKSDYILPEEILPEGKQEIVLVKSQGDKFIVDLGFDGMDGDAMIKEDVFPIDHLKKKQMLQENRYITLDEDTKLRLRFGDFTFLIGLTAIKKIKKVPFYRAIDWPLYIFLLLSFTIHFAFLGMVSMIPEEELIAMDDPYKLSSTAFKMIQLAEQEQQKAQEEEKKKKKIIAKKLSNKKIKKIAEPGDNVKKIAKVIPNKLPSNLTPEQRKIYNKKVAMSTGLASVLAQDSMLSDLIGGKAGIGGVPGLKIIGTPGGSEGISGVSLMGSLLGGGGGLGFAAPGMGFGGSRDFAPAGKIAGLNASSLGKGLGVKIHRGMKHANLYTAVSKDIGIDPNIIRRVISIHKREILWCYQKELQKNPKLRGTVKIMIVILPSGNVAKVTVVNSSLPSQAAINCMILRIKSWQFPLPEGTGIVKVKIPFHFTAENAK